MIPGRPTDAGDPGEPLDDPGWTFSPRLLLFLVPGYLARRSRRPPDRQPDGLETTRQIWTSFVAGAVLFGLVILVVVPGTDTGPVDRWIAGLALTTIALLAAVAAIGRRDLDGTSPPALAQSYRSRFFLQAACSEAIAFLAFVGTFATGVFWLYWLFLPFALFAYAHSAPTASHLRAEQDRLRDRGCSLSLVAALRTAHPA